VILALTVLGPGPPGWAGYLEFAFGVGAVLAATVERGSWSDRRLGGADPGPRRWPSRAGALGPRSRSGPGLAGTRGSCLAVAGAGPLPAGGGPPAPLLQRSVPPAGWIRADLRASSRGSRMAGLAVGGACSCPRLAHLGREAGLAVLGVAARAPRLAAGGRRARWCSASTRAPPCRWWRSPCSARSPLFAELPAPAIEGPGRWRCGPVRLERRGPCCESGRGDPGDAYFTIAAGELDRRCRTAGSWAGTGRGDGVGEIALLRAVPRTATVTAAHTPANRIFQLDRDLFLDRGARARPRPGGQGRGHRPRRGWQTGR